MAETKDLQLVPETLLKKRHNLDELRLRRADHLQKQGNNKVFSKSRKHIYVKKPETFLARAISQRNHDIRFKRVLKKGMQKRASNKPIYLTKQITADGQQQDDDDSEQQQVNKEDNGGVVVKYRANSVGAKMVFVVRIRDNTGICPKVRRVLESRLDLRYVYNGVFVKYSAKNRKLLHLVEPWVLYGTPTRGMVEDLLNRRGHGYVQKQRTPLTDNTLIEQALGNRTGILCVEDMVHELVEAGEHFANVTNFLCPFRLSPPKTDFEKQKLNEKETQTYGDQGEAMDDFIQKML